MGDLNSFRMVVLLIFFPLSVDKTTVSSSCAATYFGFFLPFSILTSTLKLTLFSLGLVNTVSSCLSHSACFSLFCTTGLLPLVGRGLLATSSNLFYLLSSLFIFCSGSSPLFPKIENIEPLDLLLLSLLELPLVLTPCEPYFGP